MARVSIYLNFMGNTEEAFHFYRDAFQTEITSVTYMRDIPADPGSPPLSEQDAGKIANIELPILGGALLMGTDVLESAGQSLVFGNNVHINLEPDTAAEGRRLFEALSAGGNILMPLTPMFWGDVFGAFIDRFGVSWMCNLPADR